MNSGAEPTTTPPDVGRRRTPYFARPKHPHDWRWGVSLVGKVLITMGLLMFAFVAYQLWGTGIQTAQAQQDLEAQFRTGMQSTSTSTPTTVSPTTGTDPVVTDPAPTTSTIPVAPSTPPVPSGDPIGVLRIPKIGIDDLYIVEGVDVPDLKKGPGHFRETPMPGQLGNAAVAGHRTTYGAPFYDLDRLEPGDLIEIDTYSGHFVYAVTGSTVVPPSGYAAVIPTTDPSVATLTLATCTPRYSARDRLIVTATLVPEQSDQVMAPPSATVPPDPSSTLDTVPETLPGESTPDTTTGTSPPTTAAPTTPEDVPGAAEDSFSQGWFDDTSAIPQALLWGLVLVAVGVGAYFVGRSTQRLWVSFLVGLIPFVIVLYFFFENVNRLLPPSL